MRDRRRRFSSPWGRLSAVALSGWIACGAPAGFAAAITNLPPTARSYGAWQYQRLRFRIAPLLSRADRAIAKEDYRAAREPLEAVLRLDPGQNAARLALLEVYHRLEAWPEALAVAESLTNDYPTYPDAYFQLGVFARKLDRPENALTAWESFLALTPPHHPSLPVVRANLAEAYFQAGRFLDAIRLAEEVRRVQDSAWVRLLLAECFLRRNQPLQAWEILPRDGTPPVDAAQRRQVEELGGQALFRLGRHAELAAMYRQRLEARFSEPDATVYSDALAAAEDWGELARVLEEWQGRTGLSAGFRSETLDRLFLCHQRLGDDRGIYRTGWEVFRLSGKLPPLLEAAKAAQRLDRAEDAAAAYAAYLDRSFEPEVALDDFYLLKNHPGIAGGQAILERVVAATPETSPLRTRALHELAQIHRIAGRRDEYLRVLQQVYRGAPSPDLALEYGEALREAGRAAEALEPLERALAAETRPERRWALGKLLAGMYLEEWRPDAAEKALQAVADAHAPDFEWAYAHARVARLRGRLAEFVERLLPLAAENDRCALELSQALLEQRRPGPALYYLKGITAPENLTPPERFFLHATRAWLYLDQGSIEEASGELELAWELGNSKELRFFELSLLAARGRHEEVCRRAQAWLDEASATSAALTDAERAEILWRIAQAEVAQRRSALAVATAARALPIAPHPPDWYRLRGEAYLQTNDFANAVRDLTRFVQAEPRPPAAVFGEMGYAKGQLKDYPGGAAAFGQYLSFYPYDIASWQELGYLNMRAARNPEAKQAFARSIDLLSDAIPQLPSEEAERYRSRRLAMKQEFTKLDKVFGFEANLQRNEYGVPAAASAPTIQGALPSWTGLEASFRPPKVGFRDERTLEAFGRVLASFEGRAWQLDEDSYQAGVGLRYRPFRKIQYTLSFERLVAIGDHAEDNWLWRNLAGWEHSSRNRREQEFWYTRLYGELSHYFERSAPWFVVGQVQTGPAWFASRRGRLVLPEFSGLVRQQWDDPTRLGSYQMAGMGARLRLVEGERDYTFGRWTLEAFARYDFGRFTESPPGFEGETFQGFCFGLNLLK